MKRIAILSPWDYSKCETFIKSHIDNIQHEVFIIHGHGYHEPYLLKESKNTFINRLQYLKTKLFYKLSPKVPEKILVKKLRQYQLKKILKKHKIDLVFAEFITVGAYATPVCKQLNIPIISIALGFDISKEHIIKKNRVFYKNLFRYCKNIIIVSNHMRKKLLELGCENEKIVYSPIGPDKSFYQLKPSFNKNNIFALGRFVDKKAPHLLILSFVEVLKEVPDARLIIGGDGPLFNACLDLIKYYKINNSVDLIGRISQEEEINYLENTSVFVQHSKTAIDGDTEGTPVAILEASAAALPIVSTLHAGIPEVVVNNQTGYLVNEGDVTAMSEKLIFLLSNKQHAQSMGKKGRDYILENFTLDKHIQVINNLIEKSIQST